MDFVPWTSFARSVAHYGGDHRIRRFSCAEQYRAMAFAQLTYRESLRDIEACLNAQAGKLYGMGFRSPLRRSTLADANENRDWRIYAELAERLMAQARRLYASESLGFDLDTAAYALDATTIELCLSLFPWAHFRPTLSAVKMHTLLDLRGSIPAFIHITTGNKSDLDILDHIAFQQSQKLSQPLAPHPFPRSGDGEKPGLPLQSVSTPGHHHLRPLQKSLAGGVVLQVDQTASAHQDFFRYQRERRQNPNLDRRLRLPARCHRQKTPRPAWLALHFSPSALRHPLRENAHFTDTPALSLRL